MSKSTKDWLSEDHHPTMFVSMDGNIGSISGVSFVRRHVYVREPRWHIPASIWYWLADRFTYVATETVTDLVATDKEPK